MMEAPKALVGWGYMNVSFAFLTVISGIPNFFKSGILCGRDIDGKEDIAVSSYVIIACMHGFLESKI